MTTVTRTAPVRQRKPLEPVNVRGYFIGGATADDFLRGAVVLAIVDAENVETPYWCEAILDGGRFVGVKLLKFGEADRHFVYPQGCDCPDATYRPDRPGGCRHVNAVKQALVSMARGGSTAAEPLSALRPVSHFCEHCQQLLEVCDGETFCPECDRWGLAPDGSAA